MNIKSLLGVALFSITTSFAAVDYKISNVTRSYPTALSFKGEVGYAQKVWGDPSGIKYGYVRPSLTAQSSAVVNYVHGQVSFFPISFLGFNVGKSKGTRNVTELDTFNCELVSCGGRTTRNFYGMDLALAYKAFSFVAYLKKESVELENNDQIFADEFSTLEATGKEDVTSLTNILAYKQSDKITWAILSNYNKTKNTDQTSLMTIALGKYSYKKWGFGLGAGNFHSRFDSNHFTMLATITWEGEKGLRLF